VNLRIEINPPRGENHPRQSEDLFEARLGILR